MTIIYLASDHAGFELKERIKEVLHEQHMPYVDLVPENDPKDDYPDISELLATKMREAKDNVRGLAVCGTSQGICIGLNRYNHIRAGLLYSPKVALLAREHNHINVGCIPGPYSGTDFTDKQLLEIIETFMATKVDDDERHARRVGKLTKLHSSKIKD